jgi:hypothetical protein
MYPALSFFVDGIPDCDEIHIARTWILGYACIAAVKKPNVGVWRRFVSQHGENWLQ